MGRAEMYDTLEKCTSDVLSEMYATLPADVVAAVVSDMQQLRARIIESLKSKLAFWDQIPWMALGIFWVECGGVEATCKAICQTCFDQYDSAMAKGYPVHRVAHRLFAPTSKCRHQLALWISLDKPLSFFRMHMRCCWNTVFVHWSRELSRVCTL